MVVPLKARKGGTPDLKVTGTIKRGKNQNPPKRPEGRTKKIPGPKFNSKRNSDAEFQSHKNFQKALHDIIRQLVYCKKNVSVPNE